MGNVPESMRTPDSVWQKNAKGKNAKLNQRKILMEASSVCAKIDSLFAAPGGGRGGEGAVQNRNLWIDIISAAVQVAAKISFKIWFLKKEDIPEQKKMKYKWRLDRITAVGVWI